MFQDDWLIQDSQDVRAESTFLHYGNPRIYKLGISFTFQELVIYFRPFGKPLPTNKADKQICKPTKYITQEKVQWLLFFNCIHLKELSDDFAWVLLNHLCNMWNVNLRFCSNGGVIPDLVVANSLGGDAVWEKNIYGTEIQELKKNIIRNPWGRGLNCIGR